MRGIVQSIIVDVEATRSRHTSGSAITESIMASLAKRYVWWKPPEEAMKLPEQIIAQVMNMGAWDDVCLLERIIGTIGFRRVIEQAEIGMFNERSWHYWHHRLGLAPEGKVPTMPKRNLGND